MSLISGKLQQLSYFIFPTREEMGRQAAAEVEQAIVAKLLRQEQLRIIFAAAPSQRELLAGLRSSSVIEWPRITAFHMDEYLGLDPQHPAGFGNFLRRHLFDWVPLAQVHLIDSQAPDPLAECRRYGALLRQQPIDLVCLGIGENGHLAFNDPPVADFSDPQVVKVVELEQSCRQQQVNDGCFARLQEVPRKAITLTIPTLVAAEQLFCVVPGPSKSEAVRCLFHQPMGPGCPASILRRFSTVRLYLDQDSAGKISG